MDRDEAIASWVDGDPALIAQLTAEDGLLAEMLEQESIHVALAAYYDSGQASERVRASVMADILASATKAAKVAVLNSVAKTRGRKRFGDQWRMAWLGGGLAAAACLVLVLASRQYPPADPDSPAGLAVAPTPAATPAPIIHVPVPGTRVVESTPPPSPPAPSIREIVPEPTPPAIVAAAPLPVPEPTAAPETVTVVPTPPPVVASTQAAPGRNPNLRPFSDESPWNLPLPANTRLTSSRLTARDKNLRIFLRWQPVFVSAFQMPERELWTGDSKVGVLRMPPAVNLQMFLNVPLILVAPDGLTAWEVTRPRPSGEGRIEADSATLVDLAGFGHVPPGQPLIAGIIRQGELENGIPHALSIGLPASLTKSKCPVGSRLAIPKTSSPEKFGAAREIALALRDFGGFVTFTSQSDSIEILSASAAPPGIQSVLQDVLSHLRMTAEPDSRLIRPAD